MIQKTKQFVEESRAVIQNRTDEVNNRMDAIGNAAVYNRENPNFTHIKNLNRKY